MTDALGWRRKIGVLVPSTNSIVEPELHAMSVPGVSLHTSRIPVSTADLRGDAALDHLVEHMRQSLASAVAPLLSVEPDHLLVGISIEAVWDGRAGNERLRRQLQGSTGLPVTTAADAIEQALARLPARRIGLVTPYDERGNQRVVRYFSELGVAVTTVRSAVCRTAGSIARVPEDERRRLLEDAAVDADAVVQFGTNLCMARLADEAERRLGKPIIAVNAALYWAALRDGGITDRIAGFGCLLREH